MVVVTGVTVAHLTTSGASTAVLQEAINNTTGVSGVADALSAAAASKAAAVDAKAVAARTAAENVFAAKTAAAKCSIKGGATAIGKGGCALLVVGTSSSPVDDHVTYDCWKPVLHDTSEEPSNGMLMKDVIRHPHVAKVTVADGNVTGLPSITLENIWSERFEVEYVLFVETGKIACHAKPL